MSLLTILQHSEPYSSTDLINVAIVDAHFRVISHLKSLPSGHGQQIQNEEQEYGGRSSVLLYYRAVENLRNPARL